MATPLKKEFKRPAGTHRCRVGFPGTKVPGYFHSFLRNDPKPTLAEVSSCPGYPGKVHLV